MCRVFLPSILVSTVETERVNMGWTNFEFPHSSNYDGDLRELLRMYKKLVEEYDTIKSEIDTAVDFINNFKGYVGETVNEVVDAKLLSVNVKLDAISEAVKRIDLNIDEIEVSVIDLYSDMEILRNNFQTEMVAIRLEIASIYEVFAEYKNSIDDLVAGKMLELVRYIEEHVQQIERLYVVNPMTGEYVNIQKVLDMFAEYIGLGYGLTADEYDSLELSALEYDNLRLTALAYSMRGYLIFFKRLKMLMLSPFTGQMDSYDNVIYQLADLHKDSLTAEQYDSLLILADTFDLLGIDSYHYDWYGKTIAVQHLG